MSHDKALYKFMIKRYTNLWILYFTLLCGKCETMWHINNSCPQSNLEEGWSNCTQLMTLLPNGWRHTAHKCTHNNNNAVPFVCKNFLTIKDIKTYKCKLKIDLLHQAHNIQDSTVSRLGCIWQHWQSINLSSATSNWWRWIILRDDQPQTINTGNECVTGTYFYTRYHT